MAEWTRGARHHREPDMAALEEARARVMAPVGKPAGNIDEVREALYQVMWDDVGILRDASGLARAGTRLRDLRDALARVGVSGSDLRYNLTWHDWLNLDSLVTVSESIRAAAQARQDSRGAHYREDFPQTGDLERSAFSRVRLAQPVGDACEVSWQDVRFTRVRPGQSLLAA